jgi:hypothetical protein
VHLPRRVQPYLYGQQSRSCSLRSQCRVTRDEAAMGTLAQTATQVELSYSCQGGVPRFASLRATGGGASHLGTSTPHFFWAPQSFALWYCFKRCRLIGKAMIWYLVQAATILYHAAFMNGKREERKIDDRARRCNCTAGERAVRWLIGSRGGGGIPKPPSHSLGTLNLTKSRCDKGITSSYR